MADHPVSSGSDEASNDELLDAISGVLPPILNALDVLAEVGRRLHPPDLAALNEAVSERVEPVREGVKRFRGTAFPDHFAGFKDSVERAGDHVIAAFEGLAAAAGDPNGPMRAYRAMREQTRAVEALYPVANMLPPVSRFFVSRARRGDEDLLARLAAADASRSDVGVMHASQRDWADMQGVAFEGADDGRRGALSLYVPEYYDEDRAHPLIVALHGGSGNGRDFLWTWLVEARTRGVILLSPSSVDRTWSLMGPDLDSGNLAAMVARVSQRWNIDQDKLLLTGMSDGGTFCYVSGLLSDSPFTHLAPSSASFHPLLLDGTSRERLADLPIYLMHGVLDWMFPVDIARTANAALSAAGAKVVYREIDDLSHTWPRDENPRIVDWFLGGLSRGVS